jgi:hypothetical protein
MFAEFTAVQFAVRSLADLANQSTFLSGSGVEQGVNVVNGTRFLVFDAKEYTLNGIFETYTVTGGLDIRRPSDANDEADYTAEQASGKRVRVLNGYYKGAFEFRGPYDGQYRWARMPVDPAPYDPLQGALAVAPIAADVTPARDTREPQAATVVPVPPKDVTAGGVAEADVIEDPLRVAPQPAFFNLLSRLTIQGNVITIGGDPVLIRR